jgi:hypothetical protein
VSGVIDAIDDVFKIVYARFRRRFGEVRRRAAWNRACYELTGYLSWAAAGATFLVLFVTTNLIRLGSPSDHRRWGMILAGGIMVFVSVSLSRRFRPYLEQPPFLGAAESTAERWLVWRLRALSLGIFALVVVIALICRHFGVGEF